MRNTPAELKAAVVGGLVDVESLVALKDLFNHFNSENLCTEFEYPESNGGNDLRCSLSYCINQLHFVDIIIC